MGICPVGMYASADGAVAVIVVRPSDIPVTVIIVVGMSVVAVVPAVPVPGVPIPIVP